MHVQHIVTTSRPCKVLPAQLFFTHKAIRCCSCLCYWRKGGANIPPPPLQVHLHTIYTEQRGGIKAQYSRFEQAVWKGLMWQIKSHHLLFSTLKAVRFSANCFDCSVIEKAKLLTWSVQAVGASKKIPGNLDTKIALCGLIIMTRPLLCLSSYFSTVKFTETHKIQVQVEKSRCAPKKNATL